MRLVAWLAVARVVSAAPCARTGEEPPSVTTLMASKENPSTDAWVVSPSCDVGVYTPSSSGELSMTYASYERVDSVPTGIKALSLNYPKLTKGADLTSGSSLSSVSFYEVEVDLSSVKFPASVTTLSLSGDKIAGVKTVTWPGGVKSLFIANNGITVVDFALPSKLQEFGLKTLNDVTLARVSLPDSLRAITFSGTASVYGVKWPKSLVTLKLGITSIPSFEIRESDISIFSKLVTFEPGISQSSCKQSTARLQTVGSKKLCAISDALAESLYGILNTGGSGSATTPSPSTSKESADSKTSEPTISSAGSGSGSQQKKDSTTSKTTSSGSSEKETSSGASPNRISNSSSADASTSSKPSDSPEDFGDGKWPLGRTATPDNPSDIKGTTNKSKSGMGTLVYLLLAGGVVTVAIVAILGFRVCRLSRHMKEEIEASTEQGYAGHTDKWGSATNTGARSSTAPRSTDKDSSQGYVSNDVRNDKALIPFRIESNDIQLGPMIARGGFGIIFRGTYKSRTVAVKQMLPGSWKDDEMLLEFMEEIRMCAKLEHPRIVEFIGMAWKSRRDLSVIIEFMAGGDLHETLYSQRDLSPHDWIRPWGSSGLKGKADIAQDVAEAVVYLHSFSSPILHRDLKAKNVLLDATGNAKLSDFGITRELELDKTMTAEIGTSHGSRQRY